MLLVVVSAVVESWRCGCTVRYEYEQAWLGNGREVAGQLKQWP